MLYDVRRPMSTDSSASSSSFDWPANAPDRYRVLFPLGRGGMGSVEVALEEQGSFRRVVALKTMLTESSRDRRQKEMFLREARLARMLNHPNVVHAFAAGAEEERLYICMEYVEGVSLDLLLGRARAADGGLSPALTAYVLAELCDGLHAAHELRAEDGKLLGVVHRDVSPHNVMVAYSGHVKVLDFGIAKIDESKLTHTGEVKGKTAYMAPEQALGDPLDRRSDLFAVGAILYECLAGKRMWGPGTDVEVIRKLALEQPPHLADAMPHAPPELAALQARLVARDPAARPANAGDVAGELRRYISSCVSRGEAADEVAMRATMQRLFELEAAQRRQQLARALEKLVDPAGADALKKSLSTANAPLSDSERRMLASLRPRTVGPSQPEPREAGSPVPLLPPIPAVPAATPFDSLAVSAAAPPPPRRSAVPWLAAVVAVAALTGVLAVKLTVGSSLAADPLVPGSATATALTASAATAAPSASTAQPEATLASAAGTTPPAVGATAAMAPDAAPPPRARPPGAAGAGGATRRGPRPGTATSPAAPGAPARPAIDTGAF
jgi:serine/threonine-protein kinase